MSWIIPIEHSPLENSKAVLGVELDSHKVIMANVTQCLVPVEITFEGAPAGSTRYVYVIAYDADNDKVLVMPELGGKIRAISVERFENLVQSGKYNLFCTTPLVQKEDYCRDNAFVPWINMQSMPLYICDKSVIKIAGWRMLIYRRLPMSEVEKVIEAYKLYVSRVIATGSSDYERIAKGLTDVGRSVLDRQKFPPHIYDYVPLWREVLEFLIQYSLVEMGITWDLEFVAASDYPMTNTKLFAIGRSQIMSVSPIFDVVVIRAGSAFRTVDDSFPYGFKASGLYMYGLQGFDEISKMDKLSICGGYTTLKLGHLIIANCIDIRDTYCDTIDLSEVAADDGISVLIGKASYLKKVILPNADDISLLISDVESKYKVYSYTGVEVPVTPDISKSVHVMISKGGAV